MEDRLMQQLKKSVLELLVLQVVCRGSTYGYWLLSIIREQSGGLFTLREGTLYPILYRLEDEGLIRSSWSPAEGRAAPKKMYQATEAGVLRLQRYRQMWNEVSETVNVFLQEGDQLQ